MKRIKKIKNNIFIKTILLTIFVGSLLGCGNPSFLTMDNTPRKIICLGDSLTAGYGVAQKDSYPSLLQNRLLETGYDNYEVINEGISGDETIDVLKRLNKILETKPDLIILSIGANDGKRREDTIEIKTNIESIVSKIQSSGSKILLIGMEMPINLGLKYRSDFNKIYSEIADEQDIELVPFMLEGVANNKKLNIADGIHPNTEGYKIILENIWEHLE